MAGVVASAAVLLFLTDKPWTEVDRDAPQFGRSIWLVSLTLLVLAGQLYMAAAGIFPIWIAAAAGTVLAGLLVAIFTPWNSLISIAGSIDHVGTGRTEIGIASWRERVCRYVSISGAVV